MYRYLMLVLALYSPVAMAGSFSIQFSDETGRLSYATEMVTTQSGPVDLEFGALFNEDDDYMATVGVLIRNDTLNAPVVFTLGTRYYYADIGNAPGQNDTTASALTIGGELLFIPEALGGFGIGVYYFGAPSVVAFGDTDSFKEYGAFIDYLITPNSSVFVGHQTIEADMENGAEYEIDDSAYVGFSIRF